MIDAIEFTTPVHMAKILLRRPHSLSTVRAMVKREFGRAPSIDVLHLMRKKIERRDAHAQRRFGGGYDENANYSNDRYHAAMASASQALALAIVEARR